MLSHTYLLDLTHQNLRFDPISKTGNFECVVTKSQFQLTAVNYCCLSKTDPNTHADRRLYHIVWKRKSQSQAQLANHHFITTATQPIMRKGAMF
jgi:hypothetical protein